MPKRVWIGRVSFGLIALLVVGALRGAPAGEPLSVPHLLRNLESDDADVAASSARTLGVVFAPGGRGGEDRDKVIGRLIEHLGSQKSAEVRRQCAVSLGRIRAAEAAEPMKKTLADPEIEVVLAAGEAVAQILPVDDARAYLTEVGGGDNALARVGAFHGLATIAKPQDAPFLLTGVASDNWRAQQASVRGLERAVQAGATLDVEQYKAIAKVLDADTTNAAGAAVNFFAHVNNANAIAALHDAADPEIHPDAWRLRAMALRAIFHRGWPRNQAELPLVIRNLGDKTANVTHEVMGILDDLRTERNVDTRRLMPVLVAELERAEPLRRRAAIMNQVPNDPEQQYASRIAVVAAKTLKQAAESEEDWPARTQSLRLIGVTGYCGVMEDVARSVDSNVADVRSAAGTALERLGSVCPTEEAAKVAPILRGHLAEGVDWRKTTVAAGAVGAYANDATIEPLVALLAHGVLNVRRDASRSLVLIARSEHEALRTKLDAALYAKLNRDPAAWEYGAPVLAALNDTKAVPLLTRMLPSDDWRAQEAAAVAVLALAKQHAIRDEALTRALIAASQSKALQVQHACDNALRELAKAAEQPAASN